MLLFLRALPFGLCALLVAYILILRDDVAKKADRIKDLTLQNTGLSLAYDKLNESFNELNRAKGVLNLKIKDLQKEISKSDEKNACINSANAIIKRLHSKNSNE